MTRTDVPWSRESEQSVLGAVMIEPGIFSRCEIAATDFFSTNHRYIWEAITRLHARREPTDPVTVAEELERHDQLEDGGGLSYLATLTRETAAPANAPHYAKIVKDYSQLRAAQQIGTKLRAMTDASELEAHIRDLIELTKASKNHSCSIAEAMREAIDLLDTQVAATLTGLRDLDGSLGGLHNGDLVVVGARAAMGKTAFMLNLALSSTVPVGIVSGEQGRDQIGLRFAAIDGSVSLHRMRTQKMDDDEWIRVTAAINAAKDKRIWINDKPAPSIDDVVSQARAWKYEKKIGVLMVDYLQKLQGGSGDTMRERIGNIASRLKDLGRELNIPIVVLAQVKREVENRPMGSDGLGRMPYMSDLAECGIIEQEADVVLTLYRPEVYDPLEKYKGLAYVNICKNRHGPIGYQPMSWRGEYLQFGDLAKHEMGHQDRWSAA